MKHLPILLAIVCLALAGCEQPINEQEQNSNWVYNGSPAGKVFVYETTWENSPAADRYWVYVLDFVSTDSVVALQTPNRDFTPHSDFMQCVSRNTYKVFPNEKYLMTYWGGGETKVTIIDADRLKSSGDILSPYPHTH